MSPSEPKAPGALCDKCPARDGVFVPPEPAAASPTTALVVVGEGPGRNEVEERRPFIGASGRLMMRGLRTLGLKRSDTHWTNAVLCDCAPQHLKDARKCCAPRLHAELAALQPGNGTHLTVVAVGAFGARSALQRTGATPILKWRGSVSETVYGGTAPGAAKDGAITISGGRPAWVLPTIHPAFVMRSPAWSRVFEIDIERVGRVRLNGFTPPELQEGRVTLITRTLAELQDALSRLRGPDVGYDVETVGLGATTTRLVCFALSDGPLTVVVPWSVRADGLNPYWNAPATVARLVTARMAGWRTITQNGPAFDHVVSPRYGLNVSRWGDTLLAAHSKWPHLPKNLAHVVTMGLDVPPWKQLEDRGADIERLYTYNGRDSLYMILRWFQLREELGL